MVWRVFFWGVDALGTEELSSLELETALEHRGIASGHAPTRANILPGIFLERRYRKSRSWEPRPDNRNPVAEGYDGNQRVSR